MVDIRKILKAAYELSKNLEFDPEEYVREKQQRKDKNREERSKEKRVFDADEEQEWMDRNSSGFEAMGVSGEGLSLLMGQLSGIRRGMQKSAGYTDIPGVGTKPEDFIKNNKFTVSAKEELEKPLEILRSNIDNELKKISLRHNDRLFSNLAATEDDLEREIQTTSELTDKVKEKIKGWIDDIKKSGFDHRIRDLHANFALNYKSMLDNGNFIGHMQHHFAEVEQLKKEALENFAKEADEILSQALPLAMMRVDKFMERIRIETKNWALDDYNGNAAQESSSCQRFGFMGPDILKKPIMGPEKITAVLRKQIPPRDEPPRSWIGGLPMLPDGIEWPCATSYEYPEHGNIPLNFVAQIACADLPKDLWGGIGPREGWLVFFAGISGQVPYGDWSFFRVLHTHELGCERQLPANKLRIGDLIHSGSDNLAFCYERWPVDIIEAPNAPFIPRTYHGSSYGEPLLELLPDFQELLYGKIPSADKDSNIKAELPYTWGALAMMLEWTLFYRAQCPDRDSPIKAMFNDGRDLAVAAMAEEEARLAVQPEGLDAERRARRDLHIAKTRENFAKQQALLSELGDPFDPSKLLQILEESKADRTEWLKRQTQVMSGLLAEAKAYPAKQPLSSDEKSSFDTLMASSHTQWHMGRIEGNSRAPCPVQSTITLSDLLKRYQSDALWASTYALYKGSPEEQALLSEGTRLAVEARLRTIDHNRAHRLGGVNQSCQDTLMPIGEVLLLQLGTDDATGFCWEDRGGLFARIDAEALERCDFSEVKGWTEH